MVMWAWDDAVQQMQASGSGTSKAEASPSAVSQDCLTKCEVTADP